MKQICGRREHTSGKNPTMFVKEGASSGTILYGVYSPPSVASDFFIFLTCNKSRTGVDSETICLVRVSSNKTKTDLTIERVKYNSHHKKQETYRLKLKFNIL